MENFEILISLFEPKRWGPLLPHKFFKVLDFVELIKPRHLEKGFDGREWSSFLDHIKLVISSKSCNFFLLTLPNLVLLQAMKLLLVLRSFWVNLVAVLLWEIEDQAFATIS